MANEVKNLIDSIINDTNTSYPKPGEYNNSDDKKNHIFNPVAFDKDSFREKLSLYVMKDLIGAMMHDETKDVDNMIDESIMRHIHDDYNGTCYGYLTSARDRLKSPIIGNIVQEIDDTVDDVADEISDSKDIGNADKINIDTLTKNVENYDELREKLKDQVSKKVINDVAGVVLTSNDAPVFDDLDSKLVKSDANTNTVDNTEESVILRMCGNIVAEAAIAGNTILTEDGLNQAIVEYCIAEMDFLFKQNPKISIYAKYL